jgi:N-acetylglutamate synthase-like GNAT family acetyltransferase
MEDVRVRAAEMRDLAWLEVFDGHLDGASLRTKLTLGELFVAEIDGDRVGMLRLDYLWSSVPFIALVRVAEHVRRRGAGRALVAHVGDHVRSGGGDVLFSSSTAGEAEPRAWHLAVGFEESGFIANINQGGVGEVVFRMALR